MNPWIALTIMATAGAAAVFIGMSRSGPWCNVHATHYEAVFLCLERANNCRITVSDFEFKSRYEDKCPNYAQLLQ